MTLQTEPHSPVDLKLPAPTPTEAGEGQKAVAEAAAFAARTDLSDQQQVNDLNRLIRGDKIESHLHRILVCGCWIIAVGVFACIAIMFNAGRPKYAKAAPMEDTAENRLYSENSNLCSQVRELKNQLAQVQLNGAELEPIDAGSEFDRLFMAAKSEAQACRPGPRATASHSKAREGTKGNAMTTKTTTRKDGDARAAAVKMLASGEASPAEVATLAGVSRQLVNHWAQGVNWRKAREARLLKAWRQALKA